MNAIITVISGQLYAFWNKKIILWSIFLWLFLNIQVVSANPDTELLKQEARGHDFATGKDASVPGEWPAFVYEEYLYGNL